MQHQSAAVLLRKYEAATNGRRNDGWTRPASSARSEIYGSAAGLRNGARQLVRDNGNAANAVNVLETNVIGTGIRPGFDPCDRFTGANIDRWREFIETVPADEAPMLYLHHDAVTRAAEAGIDLIAHARSRGQVVDCWTIDPANGDTAAILARMVSLGAGRITTNDPIALEALWHAIPSSERPAG